MEGRRTGDEGECGLRENIGKIRHRQKESEKNINVFFSRDSSVREGKIFYG